MWHFLIFANQDVCEVFSVKIERMVRKQESVLLICIFTTLLIYNLVSFDNQRQPMQVDQDEKVTKVIDMEHSQKFKNIMSSIQGQGG